MNVPEWAIGLLVGALIALGREVASIRQTRKDVNGLGAKTGRLTDQDIRIIVTQLIITERREDRIVIARPLLDR